MEKRKLGATGIEVTLLRLGGFHLMEISDGEASNLLHRYLDAGSNYIEAAAAYGRGESERKADRVMALRQRLRYWFKQQEYARAVYASEPVQVDPQCRLSGAGRAPSLRPGCGRASASGALQVDRRTVSL